MTFLKTACPYILFLMLIIITGCKSTNQYNFSYSDNFYVPSAMNQDTLPDYFMNMRRISDSLYCAIDEVSNDDYARLIYTTKIKRDYRSKIYKRYLLSSDVWDFDPYYANIKPIYASTINRNRFPAAGVTLKQAEAYTAFMNNEILANFVSNSLPIDKETYKTNYTISEYESMNVKGVKRYDDIFYFDFQLIDSTIWRELIQYYAKNDSIQTDVTLCEETKALKEESIRLKINFINPLNIITPQDKENKQFRNLIGNMGEMNIYGTVYGGDWLQCREKLNLMEAYNVKLPSHRVGFRNCARVRRVRPRKVN